MAGGKINPNTLYACIKLSKNLIIVNIDTDI